LAYDLLSGEWVWNSKKGDFQWRIREISEAKAVRKTKRTTRTSQRAEKVTANAVRALEISAVASAATFPRRKRRVPGRDGEESKVVL
jgi:hypothetical protein